MKLGGTNLVCNTEENEKGLVVVCSSNKRCGKKSNDFSSNSSSSSESSPKKCGAKNIKYWIAHPEDKK